MKKIFPAKQGVPSILTIDLVDATGTPVTAANVSAATLTLWNEDQGPTAYINSRNATLTVKGANGGAFTDGRFTWSVAAADVPIIDQARGIGDTELHGFRLDVTHSQSGLGISEVYGMRVEVLRPGTGTTPARLRASPSIVGASFADLLRQPALDGVAKAVADGTLSLDQREQLQQLLLAATIDLERTCGRVLQRTTWTDVLDVDRDGQTLFHLRAYPVGTITSVTYADDGVFTGIAALPATAYALLRGGRTGELQLRSTADWLAAAPQSLQVVYTGGIAAHVSQLPADLQAAVTSQAAFGWKRDQNIDLHSVSQEQGSVTYYREGAGTPAFAEAVARYRTVRIH